MRKIELLRRLSEIKAKGYELSKSYDFNSYSFCLSSLGIYFNQRALH